jgi:hypothetical protein
MTVITTLQSLHTRVLLASLWIACIIAVAFVDLFSLYRSDVRAQIDSGTIFVFDIGPSFLLGVIIYVLVPTLMIPLSIALPRRTNRIVNIVVAVLFAITVAGGAVGEWGYYVLASVVEIILLAAIVVVSTRWSRSAERD